MTGPAGIIAAHGVSARLGGGGFDVLADIPWRHAYWTEGPEFAALALADGAQVTTWPDEVGTANLEQTTAAQKPIVDTASPSFNGRPTVSFDGSDDWLVGTTINAVARPFEVVVVGRLTGPAAANDRFFEAGGQASLLIGSDEVLSLYGGSAIVATTYNATNDGFDPHLFRAKYAAVSADARLYVDGTDVGGGGSGTGAMNDLAVGASVGGTNNGAVEVVFVGVMDRELTSQEASDLLAWANAEYIGEWNPLTSITWERAYWTEGPEFAALGLADGADVLTWPDEMGTQDLTTTNATTAPIKRASSANFNSTPTVDFGPADDLTRFMGVDLTDVAQPWTVMAVMRCSVRTNNKHLINGGAVDLDLETSSSVWGARTGGTFRSGGTSDTIGHLFEWRGSGSTVYLQVDGTVIINSLASGGAGLSVLTLSNNNARTNSSWCEVVFLGIKSGLMDPLDRAAIRAWAQAEYATP